MTCFLGAQPLGIDNIGLHVCKEGLGREGERKKLRRGKEEENHLQIDNVGMSQMLLNLGQKYL